MVVHLHFDFSILFGKNGAISTFGDDVPCLWTGDVCTPRRGFVNVGVNDGESALSLFFTLGVRSLSSTKKKLSSNEIIPPSRRWRCRCIMPKRTPPIGVLAIAMNKDVPALRLIN
jgi:hypothetical protein